MPPHPPPRTYDELLDLLPDLAGTARRRACTLQLMVARDELLAAEAALREAVRQSYDAGDSWLVIGTVLGVSRQAAQRRFRRQDDEPR